MSLIIPANTLAAGGYAVDNSLRFNRGSSDSLSDTQTSGNRRTWTFSTWVKKCTNGNGVTGAIHGLMSALTSDYDGIHFHNTDAFRVYFNGTSSGLLVTNRLCRDNSAFYHTVVAVDTTQATASNRVKIYINGVQETSFSTETYPSQNYDTFYNVSNTARVGRVEGSFYLDGYMSEVCWIDGQQLAPTDFGEFDEDSGIWKPIDVSGLTFGTNGFYLDFEDSSALGDDVSGNGNDFTVNNLTAIDQSTDTCTNNFATWNALFRKGTTTPAFSNGNLTSTFDDGGANEFALTTFGASSGKWYAEVKWISAHGNGATATGILDMAYTGTADPNNAVTNVFGYFGSGQKNVSGTASSYGASYTSGDIIGIALNCDDNQVTFYKNGASQGVISIIAGVTYGIFASDYGSKVAELNTGSPPYSISSGNTDGNGYGNFEYAVPSGYYSLNTKNLAEYG